MTFVDIPVTNTSNQGHPKAAMSPAPPRRLPQMAALCSKSNQRFITFKIRTFYTEAGFPTSLGKSEGPNTDPL